MKALVLTKPGHAKIEFVPDPLATAFPRVIASILEHHQQEDGSVRVPAALRTYLGAERLS